MSAERYRSAPAELIRDLHSAAQELDSIRGRVKRAVENLADQPKLPDMYCIEPDFVSPSGEHYNFSRESFDRLCKRVAYLERKFGLED